MSYCSLNKKERLDSGIYSTRLTGDVIRILELEPGSDEDSITCNIRCVSLQEAEDTYEAISYVWGDPDNTSTILCGGFEHRITLSLALALRNIRHATKSLAVWADAICINQIDAEEKGQQVKIMGKIYESAKRVLVYLGSDEYSVGSDCFSLLEEFNRFWGQQLRHYGELRKVPCKPPNYFNVDPGRWEMVAKLFELPWFHRLWVVQEAGLAKECIVQWGHATTSFAEVVELVLWLHCRADIAQNAARAEIVLTWSDIFLKAQCTLSNNSTWRTDLPLCAWVNNSVSNVPENRSFIEILRTGRLMETSNARDHVYGFISSPLALLDQEQQMVEPKYGHSVEQVYFDTACAILRHPKEAPFLLGAVDHHSATHVDGDSGWPSWVPRWDQGHWTTPLSVPYNWYCAGGHETFTAHVQSNGLLSVPCVIFDSLSWVSDTLLEQDFSTNSMNWNKTFRESGKSPIEYLWETVLSSIQHASSDLEHRFMTTLCREYPSSQEVKDAGIQMSLLRSDFAAYRRLMKRAAESLVSPNTTLNLQSPGRAVRFAKKISACDNRRLAYTRSGRMVLTPRFAKLKDMCCVFPGASVPFIIRESSEDGIYHFVGDSYIYGVMRGEIMQKNEEDRHMRVTVYLK